MDGIYNFLFYGIIAVGILLIGGLTYYRIDWARHPEKYKKEVDAYEKEKEDRKRAAQQAAIDRVKAKNGSKTSVKKKPEKKPTDFIGRLDYELKHRHDKK